MKSPFQRAPQRNRWRSVLVIVLTWSSLLVLGQNPFLPPTAFIPDGEPRVFDFEGGQRLFVYGSRDERITGYCGYGHDVWSAPLDDLNAWTNHGEVFHVKQVWDIGYGRVDEQHFGAPDCVFNPQTGKYYLYTFLGATYRMDGTEGPLLGDDIAVPGFENWGPKCLVAVGDSPVGPFRDPIMCDWPPANSAGTFDPGVLVDAQPDGSLRVFAYWGMKSGDRWAELDPSDMHTIINPLSRKPDRTAWQETLGAELVGQTSLFEASSIRRIDEEHYVFLYSSNELKSGLTYLYGPSPAGPWSYGGVIVQNDEDWLLGNNHGGIVQIGTDWYVVYHKATFDSKNRQAMIEPITVEVDGARVLIPQVEMTSQGLAVDGLPAFQRFNVNLACYKSATVYLDGTVRDPAGLNPLKGIRGPSSVVGFKYFNFGEKLLSPADGLSLKLNVKRLAPFEVNVFVAPPEAAQQRNQWVSLVHRYPVGETRDTAYSELELPIRHLLESPELQSLGGLQGKLAVFVEFVGEDVELCELVELEFTRNGRSTPNPLQPIQVNVSGGVAISTIPSRARAGESVKVVLQGAASAAIAKLLKVVTASGEELSVRHNAKAPYAPHSFSFFMPNEPVLIKPKIN